MILDLHRQGVSISVIARRVGLDRKTVRRYIARGLEPPVYGPRKPRVRQLNRFENYLRERITAFPELTGRRLHRELRELGYTGSYSVVADLLREIRPPVAPEFECRFETPPGRQAQVDFAHFRTVFTDEPSTERVVWLFSFVLGHSRMLWGRFVPHQDLPTLLRCHAAAFEALGGSRSSMTGCVPCSAARIRLRGTSYTIRPWSPSPDTMATYRKPAGPTVQRQRAKWNGHSVTYGMTFF